MKDFDELREISYELEEMSELEGTEVGEYWYLLSRLFAYMDAMSEEFEKAFKEELEEQYNHLKTYWKVQESTETITQTFKKLIFIDDFDDET